MVLNSNLVTAMSEHIEPTFKAQRRTINIGDISLEVAMLPDSTYRLSYTQATEVIEKDHNSMVRFCQSKYLKTLLGEDFQAYTFSSEVFIEGAPRPITPVTFDVACLYWQRCAAQGQKKTSKNRGSPLTTIFRYVTRDLSQRAAPIFTGFKATGNVKARALVVALLKRSLYQLADEAFGVRRSSEERSRQLREDLSKEGQARLEAVRQTLERQVNIQPETATERELKLKIRLRELDLELERLRKKTQRHCLLPDETGRNTVPGITGGAVLEDVLQILGTSDSEEAIRAIYQVGFDPQSGVWRKVQVERWVIGIPEAKYRKLLHLLREKQACF